ILGHQRLEAAVRHRDRIVAELDLPGLLVALVHREIDDPTKAVLVLGDEAELGADALAGDTGELGSRRLVAIGDEEHGIAGADSGERAQLLESRRVEELGDRALRLALREYDIAEPRSPLATCP